MLTVTMPNDHREITVHAKEQDIELVGASSYKTPDGSEAPTHLKIGESVTLIPKALSDFTRVCEGMGVLDQTKSQKEKSR